jgi:hypothetical protein
MSVFSALVDDDRTNAVLGWAAVAVTGVTAVLELAAGTVLWGVFTLGVAAVLSLPAAAFADPRRLVPWPVAALAALAGVGRHLDVFPKMAGFLGIASLAFAVTVELDAFTDVEMSRRFAVLFAVLTTLAFEALWIIAQFYSDRWLGSDLLTTQAELQWDIVGVTLVALVTGVVLTGYFERFSPAGSERILEPEGAE